MNSVIFTDIIPVTEENQLYYEMAVKFCKSDKFGTRKQAVGRAAYLKKYTIERYSLAYEASPCKRLGRIAPDSEEFYKELLSLLSWQETYSIECFYHWYKNKFHLPSFLLKPLAPVIAHMLNYTFDMDCTRDEWNNALELVLAIDPFCLAGYDVVIDIWGDYHKIRRFYEVAK